MAGVLSFTSVDLNTEIISLPSNSANTEQVIKSLEPIEFNNEKIYTGENNDNLVLSKE